MLLGRSLPFRHPKKTLSAAHATQETSGRVGRDLARVLALVLAAPEKRPLKVAEIDALAHIVSSRRGSDGKPVWPRLATSYRFDGFPPASDALYDDLLRLQAAGLIRRQSPVEITEQGKNWLRTWERSDELIDEARDAIKRIDRDRLLEESTEAAIGSRRDKRESVEKG